MTYSNILISEMKSTLTQEPMNPAVVDCLYLVIQDIYGNLDMKFTSTEAIDLLVSRYNSDHYFPWFIHSVIAKVVGATVRELQGKSPSYNGHSSAFGAVIERMQDDLLSTEQWFHPPAVSRPRVKELSEVVKDYRRVSSGVGVDHPSLNMVKDNCPWVIAYLWMVRETRVSVDLSELTGIVNLISNLKALESNDQPTEPQDIPVEMPKPKYF